MMWSVFQKGPQVFHQQEKMQRIRWARFEVETLVPRLGFIVLGMDQQRPHSGNIGGLGRAQNGIFEQRLAKALPLLGPVNRQAGQKHHRNGMTGQSLAHPAGRVLVLDSTYNKRVIPNHTPCAPADHVGLRA